MLPQFCPVRGHSGPVLTLTEVERRAFLYRSRQRWFGTRYGIRIRVAGMKILSPRPLDEPSVLIKCIC